MYSLEFTIKEIILRIDTVYFLLKVWWTALSEKEGGLLLLSCAGIQKAFIVLVHRNHSNSPQYLQWNTSGPLHLENLLHQSTVLQHCFADRNVIATWHKQRHFFRKFYFFFFLFFNSFPYSSTQQKLVVLAMPCLFFLSDMICLKRCLESRYFLEAK